MGRDPYQVISRAPSARGPPFLTEAPRTQVWAPGCVTMRPGDVEWADQREGLRGTCPFPVGQAHDVRRCINPVGAWPLSLSSDPMAGRTERGQRLWGRGVSRQVVLRVSLKMAPNPTVLYDDPKEIRCSDQVWEWEQRPRLEGAKAGSRKRLIYATVRRAWTYAWPSLVSWRALARVTAGGKGVKALRAGELNVSGLVRLFTKSKWGSRREDENWTCPPSSPHHVWTPAGSPEEFLNQMGPLSSTAMSRWGLERQRKSQNGVE